MDRTSTLFLRAVILLIGAGVLVLCGLAAPVLWSEMVTVDFDYGAILLLMYVSAIPFFIALYRAMQLLTYIDQNKAFSEKSVQALRRIKYCAATISGLYAAGMPYIFYVADKDDAPGVVALGLVFVGAGLVVAVFAAVLEKLLRNAIDIQAENDLTV